VQRDGAHSTQLQHPLLQHVEKTQELVIPLADSQIVLPNLFRVGDGFQPALGFVPRPGMQQFNLALNYLPRATAPWLARWLSQAVFELIGVLVGAET